MGKNKLDKAVKEKLYDLNTPLDTSELWQGIQGKMDTEDPKPTPLFPYRKYLGIGILLFLLMGSSYMVYNGLSTVEDADEMISSSNEYNQDDASANLNTATSTSSPNNNLDSSSKENNNNFTSTNSLPKEENSPTSLNTNRLENTANQKSTFNQSSELNRTNQNSYNSQNQESSLQSKANIFTQLDSESSTNIYGSERTQQTTHNGSGSITGTFPSLDVASETQLVKNELINSLNRLESRKSTPVSFARDVVDVCSFGNKIDCYDAWTEDNKFSIVPYIGVDFVTNDRIRTDSLTSYLMERESTMRFLEVIKAGVLLKYNFTPNLYVKIGAEYDQIREKFESTTMEAVTVGVPGTIAYRITMEGDTIPVPGIVQTTSIVTTQWRKYNKYHSFNIPIIVGHQAPIAKRWAYFVEAGVFYNVRFTYQGTLLDQNNQVVSGENFYLNKTGVSLYGGLGISYNISKNLSAFAVGSYKYNLESINNADYNPIKQNLGLAGIAVGLEYRF